MPNQSSSPQRSSAARLISFVFVGILILGFLAALPAAWALPAQIPDSQTVPTLTPTRPSGGGSQPTATSPSGGGSPTNTPQPGATATPVPPPGATATATPPPGATATPTPTATVTPTATPTLVPAPIQPASQSCWTIPTPGFQPEQALSASWTAESDQYLVMPGQTITLRLIVKNTGTNQLANLTVCNPIMTGLVVGKPTSTQGRVWVEQPGIVAQLGNLAAGSTARIDVKLSIPATQPLGGVIENQGWLFSGNQRSSTNLLTWALPPAYLPKTGQ